MVPVPRVESIDALNDGFVAQCRQGARLRGHEETIGERLSQDPVMRTIVDRKGLDRLAASTSQMGRFETGWLATDDNLAALTDLSGLTESTSASHQR